MHSSHVVHNCSAMCNVTNHAVINHRSPIYLQLPTIFFADFIDADSRQVEFGDKVSAWVRDIPYVGPAVEQKAVQPVRRMVDKVEDSIQKKPQQAEQNMQHFVKRIESLMTRLIPNQYLVQDLMGYVSARRPKTIFKS